MSDFPSARYFQLLQRFVDALRLAYGARYASVPLDTRARALRAGASYLRAIGVTEDTLPDAEALAKLLRLTIDVMRGVS